MIPVLCIIGEKVSTGGKKELVQLCTLLHFKLFSTVQLLFAEDGSLFLHKINWYSWHGDSFFPSWWVCHQFIKFLCFQAGYSLLFSCLPLVELIIYQLIVNPANAQKHSVVPETWDTWPQRKVLSGKYEPVKWVRKGEADASWQWHTQYVPSFEHRKFKHAIVSAQEIHPRPCTVHLPFRHV